MQGNLIPDKNLMVGALAGILTKFTIWLATSRGITIETDTQGYIIVLTTWLAAHAYIECQESTR